MRQYSIDQVEVAWRGLDFAEGFAQGTAIVEARSAPSFTLKMSARGKGRRTYNPDRSGTLTFTVDQESQLHQSLKAIAEADRNPNTRDQVGTLVLKDLSSGETFEFLNSFISTDPDDGSRGTESGTFAWIFMYEDKKSAPVENLLNVVGT